MLSRTLMKNPGRQCVSRMYVYIHVCVLSVIYRHTPIVEGQTDSDRQTDSSRQPLSEHRYTAPSPRVSVTSFVIRDAQPRPRREEDKKK